MIDINKLRRLAQAVSGWSNCNQSWLDQSEDAPAAAVGHIDEDGNTYPVATIDCDQYYAGHQSLPLAKFYAAVNPAAVSELLDRLETAESARRDDYQNWMTALDRNAELLAKLEAAEKERDKLRTELKEIRYGVAVAHDTIKALRAKIERMERLDQVAQPAPSVQDGWKLVPIEPTPGMIDAAEYVDWGDADVRGSCINAWNRMLSVAPEAKP